MNLSSFNKKPTFLIFSFFSKLNLILAFIISFLLVNSNLFAQEAFITTWKTDNPGNSNNTSITINTENEPGFNFDVDWNGDGVYTQFGLTNTVTHEYGIPGTYTIRIKGDFPGIFFSANAEREQLISIDQWGKQKWTSLSFAGCTNLKGNASDAPDLSLVTDLSYMFSNCTQFNQDLNNWDTSTIENMAGMFQKATAFNGKIGNWDTSNVDGMLLMFEDADSFNQPIGNWDTSKVETFGAMFDGAISFNQPIGNWNTSNVEDMGMMFRFAISFNQDLNSWDTSKVTIMEEMFSDARAFNGKIGNWDTSNVETMFRMFEIATSFNQPIGNWDTSNVSSMASMFSDARAFNQPIGNWDVFATELYSMFNSATSFNQPIGNWNITGVTELYNMFSHASSFNQDLSNWDTSFVENMDEMFDGAISFDQNLGSWNIQSLETADWMFKGVKLSTANYDGLLIGWNAQPHKGGVDFDGGHSQYCLGENARNNLIGAGEWVIDDGGKDPNCSSVALTCPTITFPAINATKVITKPTITWDKVTGATRYRIVIIKTSDNTEVLNILLAAVDKYTLLTPLNTNTTYKVSVYPSENTTENVSCAAVNFTTAGTGNVPICTSLNTPFDGEDNIAIDATLSWLGASDADGYRITIRTSTTTIVDDKDVFNTTTYNAPVSDWLAGQQYFVTVIAYNNNGTAINCKETSFTTIEAVTAPNCPTITSPQTGTSDVATNPSITWNAIQGVTSYRITIGTTGGGTEIIDETLASNILTYTPNPNLSNNTLYYITLFASNTIGESAPCSSISFTTGTEAKAPNCPTITSPQTGTAGVATNPSITWNAIGGVTSYRITIGTTDGGTEITDKTLASNILTYTPSSNLSNNTLYYVTLFTSNSIGESASCSSISFTTMVIPTTALDIPKFFSPNNDGTNDTWVVNDPKNIIVSIYIFDRHGKVLKKLRSNQSWDGNYMGKPMGETDYWYLIELNTGEKRTGHFSLLRK